VNLKVIEKLLSQKFQEPEFEDCYLIDLEYSESINKLQVYIDSDSGFGFDKCRKISRYLESYLDEKGELGEKYILEVSSPGLSRPLKIRRQYIKNIGRQISLKLDDGSKEEGTILAVDGEELRIQVKNVERKINFDMVKSAKILPSFK
jgi:ribosome maturation factor RimP